MGSLAPVYTAPSGDPSVPILTLDEVKEDAKLAGTAEDSRLERIIASVTDTVERSLARPVRKRPYQAYFARPPCAKDAIFLPSTPVISVDSAEVYENGSWTVIPATAYRVSRTWTDASPPPAVACVVEAAGANGWGDIDYDDVVDPFRLTITCGWGTIPPGIKHGAIRMAVDNYVLRGTKVETEQYAVGTEVELMKRFYRKPETIRFLRRGE